MAYDYGVEAGGDKEPDFLRTYYIHLNNIFISPSTPGDRYFCYNALYNITGEVIAPIRGDEIYCIDNADIEEETNEYIVLTDIWSDGSVREVLDIDNFSVSYLGTVRNFTRARPTLAPKQYTLTVTPTPSDAIVKINGEAQTNITVDEGTTVTYEVSKNGYITQEGIKQVDTSETLQVTLKEVATSEKIIKLYSHMQNIKQALNEKGANVSDNVSEYAEAINGIKLTLDIANIDSNGTYVPSDGFDGFSEVNVNVPSSDSLSEDSVAKLNEMIGG